MCMMSVVMDQYKPYIPDPLTWPHRPIPVPAPKPAPLQGTYKFVPTPIVDPEKLQELIDAFHAACAAAEKFDRLTGQPDCVDPDKAELLDRITELERRLDEHDKK